MNWHAVPLQRVHELAVGDGIYSANWRIDAVTDRNKWYFFETETQLLNSLSMDCKSDKQRYSIIS